MGKASENCIACVVHFMLASFLMAIIVWGFDGGAIISKSQSLLTGMATVNNPAQGVLVVSSDASWYSDILEQQAVEVRFIEGSKGSTLIVSGDQDSIMKALLDAAGHAQRRGDLISYYLNVDPTN